MAGAVAEVQGQPAAGKSERSGIIAAGDAKGIIQSISQGIRQLLLLEEKLASLSREDDRFRRLIEDLQAIVQRMAGHLDGMDKRIAERFAEIDKRLAETDRRVQLQIELAVRNALDKRDGKG